MCPIGPGIVSGVDPREQTLRTYRNGELVQEANIGEELLWGPDYMIADLARHITLMPGDIVLTGPPAIPVLWRSVTPSKLKLRNWEGCPAPSPAGRVRGRKQDINPPTAMRSGASRWVTTIECQTVSKTITGEHQDHCRRKRPHENRNCWRRGNRTLAGRSTCHPAAPFLCWPEARH